jgi:hypothetical protein
MATKIANGLFSAKEFDSKSDPISPAILENDVNKDVVIPNQPSKPDELSQNLPSPSTFSLNSTPVEEVETEPEVSHAPDQINRNIPSVEKNNSNSGLANLLTQYLPIVLPLLVVFFVMLQYKLQQEKTNGSI